MDFKNILAAWYRDNKRELPWRETSNPYFIWISEVILQQTRVVQGIGYYYRFIESFPTVKALAGAKEDEVLKVWQGLGYYTRARNLHAASKLIMEKYDGKLPESYDELLKIRGIGPYSAGAIASFAFNMPVPAIDGNVYRIIARVFGLFASPYTASGRREFFSLVNDLMDKKSPGSFNQALLDFGALQCVPQSPSCSACPFISYCYAFRNNMIASLPVKAKRIVPKNRFFTYLLIRFKEYTFIHKRNEKDIWHSLYEFPLIESDKLPLPEELRQLEDWQQLFKGCDARITYFSSPVKHQLSHQTILSQYVIVEISKVSAKLKSGYKCVENRSISNYSTPKLIDNFLAAEPAAKYFRKE
ncbi:MAG: A/G-specific adenine glycosylase [Bacteroidales bacterium]